MDPPPQQELDPLHTHRPNQQQQDHHLRDHHLRDHDQHRAPPPPPQPQQMLLQPPYPGPSPAPSRREEERPPYRGVRRSGHDHSSYTCSVALDGSRRAWLGRFFTEEAAALAYDVWAVFNRAEHEMNFPDRPPLRGSVPRRRAMPDGTKALVTQEDIQTLRRAAREHVELHAPGACASTHTRRSKRKRESSLSGAQQLGDLAPRGDELSQEIDQQNVSGAREVTAMEDPFLDASDLPSGIPISVAGDHRFTHQYSTPLWTQVPAPAPPGRLGSEVFQGQGWTDRGARLSSKFNLGQGWLRGADGGNRPDQSFGRQRPDRIQSPFPGGAAHQEPDYEEQLLRLRLGQPEAGARPHYSALQEQNLRSRYRIGTPGHGEVVPDRQPIRPFAESSRFGYRHEIHPSALQHPSVEYPQTHTLQGVAVGYRPNTIELEQPYRTDLGHLGGITRQGATSASAAHRFGFAAVNLPYFVPPDDQLDRTDPRLGNIFSQAPHFAPASHQPAAYDATGSRLIAAPRHLDHARPDHLFSECRLVGTGIRTDATFSYPPPIVAHEPPPGYHLRRSNPLLHERHADQADLTQQFAHSLPPRLPPRPFLHAPQQQPRPSFFVAPSAQQPLPVAQHPSLVARGQPFSFVGLPGSSLVGDLQARPRPFSPAAGFQAGSSMARAPLGIDLNVTPPRESRSRSSSSRNGMGSRPTSPYRGGGA